MLVDTWNCPSPRVLYAVMQHFNGVVLRKLLHDSVHIVHEPRTVCMAMRRGFIVVFVDDAISMKEAWIYACINDVNIDNNSQSMDF